MASFHGISIQMTIHISPENVPKCWEAFRLVYKNVISELSVLFSRCISPPKIRGLFLGLRIGSLPLFVQIHYSRRYTQDLRYCSRSKPKEWIKEA
ncbi:uncharacterized protein BJX67DRAFT_361637 [Aspergillus lucknowensis]|uniref:Uncharacterized protein n=1 Tax=Aspergillus lucknowensis TaxID=176173 RepID=A0ABR4LIB0_9EURO